VGAHSIAFEVGPGLTTSNEERRDVSEGKAAKRRALRHSRKALLLLVIRWVVPNTRTEDHQTPAEAYQKNSGSRGAYPDMKTASPIFAQSAFSRSC